MRLPAYNIHDRRVPVWLSGGCHWQNLFGFSSFARTAGCSRLPVAEATDDDCIGSVPAVLYSTERGCHARASDMMRRVLAVFVCVALLAHAAHVDVQSEDAEDEFDLDLATTPAPAVRSRPPV